MTQLLIDANDLGDVLTTLRDKGEHDIADTLLRLGVEGRKAAEAGEAVAWRVPALEGVGYRFADEGTMAALRALLTPVPGFNSVAKRKRVEIEGDGYVVNGIALMHPETRRRCLLDSLGAVHWIEP